jgi:hypothetical protein
LWHNAARLQQWLEIGADWQIPDSDAFGGSIAIGKE